MNKIELKDSLADLGIIEKTFIKKEDITDENKDKIVSKDGYDYIYSDGELTESEIRLALLTEQTKNIRSIKGMVSFFVILLIVSIALSLIAIL